MDLNKARVKKKPTKFKPDVLMREREITSRQNMAAAYLSMSTCVKYALVMEMSAVIGGRIALIFVPYIDAAMRTGCNFLVLSTSF